MKPGTKLSIALVALAAVGGALATLGLLWATPDSLAAEAAATRLPGEALAWGFGAAALATGMSSLGAGYAVAKVGSAAVGALAEKPELFARMLILVGLAEGIAIYGLIVSVLLLNQLG